MIFTNILSRKPIIEAAHDGQGKISFRRVLSDELRSKINFLDYSVIPPHSSIGYHQHIGTEEVYIIKSGSGIMTINGERRRVMEMDVIVATDGDWHGLENDTDIDIEVLVFECSME